MSQPYHRVTIVGRPNVGKSSLLNRMAGRRVSIVEPTAGVTRDRVAISLEWQKQMLEIIDTGGLGLVDDQLLKEHIESQIEVGIAGSDLILFVVDSKEGLVPMDEMVAKHLRRLSAKVLLVVNKVESQWEEFSVHEWARLGFGAPMPVSANEGFGITDLLDEVCERLPKTAPVDEDGYIEDPLRIAIVGKRNSGKSTLFNLLLGEERVIVSDVPGTTRDAVDVKFEHEGRLVELIDTAGMRKQSSLADAIEFFSQTRAISAIRRAHVVLHLFDVTQKISQVDKKIAEICIDNHKPVVLVGNKIDLAEGGMQVEQWDAYVRQQLAGLAYAPLSFVSALDDENVDETMDVLFDLRELSRTKLSTAKLNDALQEAKQKLRPRSKSVMPKLFYGTQTGTEPISILVFVNEPKLFRGQYERYLQNQLQQAFGLDEIPIKLVFKKRKKVVLDPE